MKYKQELNPHNTGRKSPQKYRWGFEFRIAIKSFKLTLKLKTKKEERMLLKDELFFPDWEEEAPLPPFFKSIYLCEFRRYEHDVNT